VKQEGTVNVPLDPVVERDPEAVAVQRLDAGDSEHYSFMLGQRLDRHQRLQCLGTHPVIGELLGMESCPRSDEPQRTRWKRSIENAQSGELDLRDLVAILGVEVRRRMIGAVHPYDDSVERGQTGHCAIVGYRAADMAGLLSLQCSSSTSSIGGSTADPSAPGGASR